MGDQNKTSTNETTYHVNQNDNQIQLEETNSENLETEICQKKEEKWRKVEEAETEKETRIENKEKQA